MSVEESVACHSLFSLDVSSRGHIVWRIGFRCMQEENLERSESMLDEADEEVTRPERYDSI